jgi:hypothetical protein
MSLMYGKIGLLEVQDGTLTKRYPTADAFERMAKALSGVKQVKRIDITDKPSVFLFEVDREKRGPLFVIWERRDAFSGEDAPAVPVDLPWATKTATALDALGQAVPVEPKSNRLHFSVSLTPIFVEPVH